MDEEAIRKAAYEIWEKQGRPEGQEFEHWLQAEHELDGYNGGGLTGSVSTTEETSPITPQPPPVVKA